MKITKILQLALLFGAIAMSSCSRLYTSRNYVKGYDSFKINEETEKKKHIQTTEIAAQQPESIHFTETPSAPQNLIETAFPVNFEKKASKAAQQWVKIQGESTARSIVDNKTQAPQIREQGTVVPAPKDTSGEKSQLVALLLCFFLGYIGIHRFYLGYPLIGFLQIITLGGCGIWALIDFIMIITGDLQPKNGPYDKTFEDY